MSALTGATGILILLLMAAGLLAVMLGAMLVVLQRRRGAGTSARHRLPQQWPLNPRPIAHSSERHVWRWLRQVFPEHHVMVKLPITRFTMPRQSGEGQEWFDLLSRTYCTFSLCNDNGHVIGCVDVLGPQGLSRGNRQLKQTLLAQCGIGYCVVSAESLPNADTLRADFLGASQPDSLSPHDSEEARLDEVRLQLHEALDRKRHNRSQHALDAGQDSDENASWPQQADSFLGSLDSRRAPLDHR